VRIKNQDAEEHGQMSQMRRTREGIGGMNMDKEKKIRGDGEKCHRCGVRQPYQGYECCEPCLNEMLLGPPAVSPQAAWNRFVEEFTGALLRSKKRQSLEHHIAHSSNRPPKPFAKRLYWL